MEIRKAERDDFDELLKLKLEAKEQEKKFNPKLKTSNDVLRHYKRYLTRDLNSEWRKILIATKGNQIIGMILGKIFRSMYINGHERIGYMTNLYVKEEYRKNGVAMKLINSLFNWFKSKDCKELTLEVYEKNNKAKQLFTKLGFENYSVKMVRKI